MHFIRRFIDSTTHFTRTRNSNDGLSHLIDRTYIPKQQRMDQYQHYRHHHKVNTNKLIRCIPELKRFLLSFYHFAVSTVFCDNAAQFESDLNSDVFGCFLNHVDIFVTLRWFVGCKKFSTEVGSTISNKWRSIQLYFLHSFDSELKRDVVFSVGRFITSPVDCVINQEFSVACLQEGDEVYVPFSFLRDYFEVHGSLSTVGKHPPRFDWMHTNAKINYPKGIYDPKGIFMYFENYNVEVKKQIFMFWKKLGQ